MYVSIPHTREGTKITQEDPGTRGLRRNKDGFWGGNKRSPQDRDNIPVGVLL